MPRLTREDRAKKIFEILRKNYPDAACELRFSSPLELLVATILSAQCTDARVNVVTPELFAKYPTAQDYADASVEELEAMIRSTGFFKNKARSIRGACGQMLARHGGKVPESMEALTALPGVGRKTANLVRAYAFGKPGIICDTHVLRVSKRLGLTLEDNPEKVESDLAELFLQKHWTTVSTVLMFHGRRCCVARKPKCPECCVRVLCPEGKES